MGGETRSLRVQPPRKVHEAPFTPSAPVAPAAASNPGATGHPEYDDEGATSPFHAMAIVEKARAFNAAAIAPIAPVTSKPPPPRGADPHGDDLDDSADTGAARTLFQPRFAPPETIASGERPRATPAPQPAPAPTPIVSGLPADRSYPVDLVQRREGDPTPRPPEVVGAQPYGMPPQPYGMPPQPIGLTPQQQGFQPPQQPERAGLPAILYVLLSVLLVGGAAAVLVYVLRLRNG